MMQPTLDMSLIDVDFFIKDFSEIGLKKMVAVYSHASGKELRMSDVRFPDPVLTAEFDLKTISIRFFDTPEPPSRKFWKRT